MTKSIKVIERTPLMPAWAKYWAMNKDGTAFYYASKPEKNEIKGCWVRKDPSEFYEYDPRNTSPFTDMFPGLFAEDDWDKSLSKLLTDVEIFTYKANGIYLDAVETIRKKIRNLDLSNHEKVALFNETLKEFEALLLKAIEKDFDFLLHGKSVLELDEIIREVS